MHLFTIKSNFTQISKRSTPTDLHHPDLNLAQFISLETRQMSSAYAKTCLGLKMGKTDYYGLKASSCESLIQ